MASKIDRRDFVKAGVAAAAGAAITRTSFATAAPSSKTISIAGGMPVRTLGKTGHRLPVFGHGGSAMVKMWGKDLGVEVAPFEERVAMVRHGYDKGIRYFDTARVYQDSEDVIGEALKDVRDDVYLCTKVTVPTAAEARPAVEKSLEVLQTDYIDCLQLHGAVYQRVGYDTSMTIVEEIVKLHEEKVCRFMGLTGHGHFEIMHRLLQTGIFDQLLVAYGYFARAYDSTISNSSLAWRDLCIAEAHQHGMGIVAMKVLGASFLGHRSAELAPGVSEEELKRLPGAAIRWVLQDERIAVLNLGISVPADIDEDHAVFTGEPECTAEDRALLAKFSAKAYGSDIVREMKVS
jgi:predicted aldo/keto reductase-like oxidoreductase